MELIINIIGLVPSLQDWQTTFCSFGFSFSFFLGCVKTRTISCDWGTQLFVANKDVMKETAYFGSEYL